MPILNRIGNIIHNTLPHPTIIAVRCNNCGRTSSTDHPQDLFTQREYHNDIIDNFIQKFTTVLLEVISRRMIYIGDTDNIHICRIIKSPSYNLVTLPCGHSFDNDRFLTWFHMKAICPLDNRPVDLTDVKPNNSLSEETRRRVAAYNDIFLNRVNEHYQTLLSIIHEVGQILHREIDLTNDQILLLINIVYFDKIRAPHNSFHCDHCKKICYDKIFYDALVFIRNMLGSFSVDDIFKFPIVIKYDTSKFDQQTIDRLVPICINHLLVSRAIEFNPNYYNQYSKARKDRVKTLMMIHRLSDNILSALPLEIIYRIC